MKTFLFRNGKSGEVVSIEEGDSDRALSEVLKKKAWPLNRIIYEGVDQGGGFDPRFAHLDNVKDTSHNRK